MFTDVKVILWDVDGTLYAPSADVSHAVVESAYQTIANHTGWPRHKVIEEFAKVHEKITLSQTEAVAIICKIPVSEAARETDGHFQRTKFIKRDEQLIALFESLKGFQHYILGNGAKKTILEGLDALGLDKDIFKEIVTSEIVGANKPSDKGFLYIMDKTGLPASAHLMVGDREKVDLVPAKALGMKTCLVWTPKPSMIADVTIPTVYDLASLVS
jgi:HAD superfamily hydrolase (TIGR01549 family)